MPKSRRNNHNRRVLAYKAKLEAKGKANLTQHPGTDKGFQEGWRYPVDPEKSRELEARLGLSYSAIDATRGARFTGGNDWQVWTIDGRRCDVTVKDNQITRATITSAPDPELPHPMANKDQTQVYTAKRDDAYKGTGYDLTIFPNGETATPDQPVIERLHTHSTDDLSFPAELGCDLLEGRRQR